MSDTGFRAPSNSAMHRERQLIFGGPGSGKTRAGLSLAKLSQQTGSTATFHVIDTDFAWERMLGGKEFGNLNNITLETVFDYDDHVRALTKFQKLIVPGDWLMCDMFGPVWDLCQGHYIEKAFGVSKTDFYLAKKKAEEKGNPFDSVDWQIIKSYYQDFTMPLFHRHQGHVLVTAGAKAVRSTGQWKDTAEIVNTYGRVGVRPEGEKRLGHLVHTIMLLKAGKSGWTMTTIKDREREQHVDVGVKNYGLDYLRKTAEWVMR